MSELPVVTVTALNDYIARLIDAQSILSRMKVAGEVANFRRYARALYFSIRDDAATVSCVMFMSAATKLTFEPRDGDKVILDCRAGFYKKDGRFQLIVNHIEMEGSGDLYAAYARLQKKLEAEGLFDPARKRRLPRFPRKIGVVTSASGAVIKDIINVLSRRWPGFRLCLYPCLVQGDQAAASVARGIRAFNERGDCDVLIIGRGGGSMEDLWAFNDEALARTIAASRVPIISAVGHETDFTIADFVADVRAPTPSAAAELAVPRKEDISELIAGQRATLKKGLVKVLDLNRLHLRRLSESPVLRSPERLFEGRRQRLDQLGSRLTQGLLRSLSEARRKKAGVDQQRLERAAKALLRDRGHQLATLCSRLDALSPLKILARGYGLVTEEEGRPLHSVDQVSPGDPIRVLMSDGDLDCVVGEIHKRAEDA